MSRPPRFERHTIIYENDGAEVARYNLWAASERAAEQRTTRRFFDEHPEFDEFAILPALTFRFEGGRARKS